MSGISSRATNGTVTNSVASTMPGTAKMILIPCAASHGPSHPWSPNSSTRTRPEITGETARGRSMSETRTLRPGNWNLASAHAAATPNARFSGTAMAAVTRVSVMASRAVGSPRLSRYTPSPLRNASVNTARSGANRNAPRKPSERAISPRLTHAGSVTISARLPVAATAPPPEPVDHAQDRERGDEHDEGDRGGAGVVVLLQLGDDEQGRDLRLHRHVASDEYDGPVLAQRPREREAAARARGGQERGRDHATKRLPAARAEAGGGLFGLQSEVAQRRL